MLLAAGIGERLKPLTLKTPKPLIPVEGVPLIQYNLILLQKAGVKEVMVNLHHLGDQIRRALGDGSRFGLTLHYSEEKIILGTGGGLKKVEDFFREAPFFALNADVLIDLDLKDLFRFHEKNPAEASLVVSSDVREDVKRLVYADEEGRIGAISEAKPKNASLKPYVFTGAQLIESRLLRKLPEGVECSVVDEAYLPTLASGEPLNAYRFEGYYRDVGSPERYAAVKREFSQGWPYTNLKAEQVSGL